MNYLIFAPWIIFFPLYSYTAQLILLTKKREKNALIWIRDNLFTMFRLDILLLISIFIYFTKFDNTTVDRMLFFMFFLFLFVNTLYELNDISEKIKKKEKKFEIIITYLVLTLIPIIYYYITKNFLYTCFIMCGYTFFAYLIVIIISSFKHKINKKSK